MSLSWILLCFLCGSLPMSLWVGKLALGLDIRQQADGNPGASNVWRSGGPKWGFLALLLDFSKGAVPVGVANFILGLEGWQLAAAAVAPILGHAFSPILHFRGGKALAVTFGIWTGLSVWLVPTILGISFAFWLAIFMTEGWAVMAGILSLLVALLALEAKPVWMMVWLGMALILSWKHRADLLRRPVLRPYFRRR
jgi:glycerol-3-phosphate acyltransferase PlsY